MLIINFTTWQSAVLVDSQRTGASQLNIYTCCPNPHHAVAGREWEWTLGIYASDLPATKWQWCRPISVRPESKQTWQMAQARVPRRLIEVSTLPHWRHTNSPRRQCHCSGGAAEHGFSRHAGPTPQRWEIFVAACNIISHLFGAVTHLTHVTPACLIWLSDPAWPQPLSDNCCCWRFRAGSESVLDRPIIYLWYQCIRILAKRLYQSFTTRDPACKLWETLPITVLTS